MCPTRRVVHRIDDGFWLAAPEPNGAFENGHLLVEGQRDGAVGTMTGVNEPISDGRYALSVSRLLLAGAAGCGAAAK